MMIKSTYYLLLFQITFSPEMFLSKKCCLLIKYLITINFP